MDLSVLKTGDKVMYRLSKRDNWDGTAPDWKPWKEGTLYVARREKSLKNSNKPEHQAGAIGVLAIQEEIAWAEYSQDDYSPEYDQWLVEEYRMELKLI